ncbi:MAG TPA: hypothetical protein VF627_11385 [Abditibacterium sp.]|jgi:hypothetical protein
MLKQLVYAPYWTQSLEWRAQWGVNFAKVLGDNDVFGISAATLADIKNGTDWEFYAVITHPNYLESYSKACTEWRREIDTDATPQSVEMPVFSPPAPPVSTNTQSGVFNRIAALVSEVILPAKPTPALLAQLGLNPLAAPNATTLRISNPTALPGGHVSLTLARGNAKLFLVESKRGDETAFSMLDKTTDRAFLDTRANLTADVSESRTYRYKDANDALGQYSPEVTVATQN